MPYDFQVLVNKKTSGPQKIIIDSFVQYLHLKTRKSVGLVRMDNRTIYRLGIMTPRFFIAIYKLIIFSLTKKNNKTFEQFELDGVAIGRYAAAASLRSPKASYCYFEYNKRLFTNLVKGVVHFAYAMRIKKNIDYAYLGDTFYLKGIIIDIFLTSGKKVLLLGYPHNLLFFKSKRGQLAAFVRRDDRVGFHQLLVRQHMDRRLNDPAREIHYYRPVVEKRKIELEKPDNTNEKSVIIYAHSFTDAQLVFGYDGFKGVFDWLVYTLDSLVDRNLDIYVKGHPNFWAENAETEVIYWDKLLWNKIKLKYNVSPLTSLRSIPVRNLADARHEIGEA